MNRRTLKVRFHVCTFAPYCLPYRLHFCTIHTTYVAYIMYFVSSIVNQETDCLPDRPKAINSSSLTFVWRKKISFFCNSRQKSVPLGLRRLHLCKAAAKVTTIYLAYIIKLCSLALVRREDNNIYKLLLSSHRLLPSLNCLLPFFKNTFSSSISVPDGHCMAIPSLATSTTGAETTPNAVQLPR
jgi:hypothetical protein